MQQIPQLAYEGEQIPVSRMIFCLQFKFDGNFALLHYWQTDHNKLLHMTRRHVPNFVAITLLEPRWEQNKISIKSELWWKKKNSVKRAPDPTWNTRNTITQTNLFQSVCAGDCQSFGPGTATLDRPGGYEFLHSNSAGVHLFPHL